MEKVVSSKACANCQEQFDITDRDLAHYERIAVPEPTWCPRCRHLRRHAFINDYNFYTRSCDSCEKSLVSIYPPHSKYTIICQPCWFAEERDDKASARDYDQSRPFFEQFDELMHDAPQLAIIGMNNENSSYCESVANCKNTYLISESSNCEDCYYAYWIQKTNGCIDLCYAHECEQCYQIIDCFQCYHLLYGQNCTNCSDSAFLYQCVGCRNCLFCVNQRQAEYMIFNEACSEDEYLQEREKLALHTREGVLNAQARFAEFLGQQPHKHLQHDNVENCSGDYIRSAKNCKQIYHCYDAEDCAFGEHVWRGAKDCYDANTAGRNAELIYESTNCGIDTYNVKFSRYCWSGRDIEYCNQCAVGKDLFGCVSLKPGAQYCILNKQYSRDEYEALVPQIRERMLADGEYGEFFPLSISLFGYNDSVSYDDWPLSKEEVLAAGWKWEDQEGGTRGKGTLQAQDLAVDINEVTDSICSEVLTCGQCERNYKIIPQEFSFYQREKIPLPVHCPDCRHRERLGKRNRKVLYGRQCGRCDAAIESSFSPKRPEIIYCESCYLEAVY